MTAYASTTELAEILGIKESVPSWDVGSSPVNETVGTGDDSTTVFYLDYKSILADSYTFYYGATAAATDTLTETTHFTLDKTKGKLTLTTAGVTLVSTNNIYSAYDRINNGMSDAYLQEVLERVQQFIEKKTNTKFTDGTATNPTYPVITKEEQETMGSFQDRYFTQERPLVDANSTLLSAMAVAASTAELQSGKGAEFPSSGQVVIEKEIISYTGVSTDTLTGCSRGVGDSTAAAHAAAKQVHSTIVLLSGTDEGTLQTWYVQEWNVDVHVDPLGQVFLHDSSVTGGYSTETTPLEKIGVANRLNLRYLYGFDIIPNSIKRLNLLLAKKQLVQDNISKSMIAGRDEFNPEMFDADKEEKSTNL